MTIAQKKNGKANQPNTPNKKPLTACPTVENTASRVKRHTKASVENSIRTMPNVSLEKTSDSLFSFLPLPIAFK